MTAPDRADRPRSALLDLWRGVALIDMAWVHLATYPIGMPAALAATIGEHTRFAAGALVLLSGLTVRRAFGWRLEAGGELRHRCVQQLLRRALLLVLVGQLASVTYAAIEQLARDPSWIPSLEWSGLVPVAAFRTPGVTGGLLLLYAMLLVLTPLLERLRDLTGPLLTMLISLAIFAAAQFIGTPAHWPAWTFPLAHWQPLFVAGYLASPLIERWEDSPPRAQAAWLLPATIAYAYAFVLRSPSALGLAAETLPGFEFTKVPLSPAELAWYAASSVFVMSWSGWLHERSKATRRACNWLRVLGRWSLLVYVSHLLLELPIIAFLTLVDPLPILRTTMLPLIAAAMFAVAATAELVSNGRLHVVATALRPAFRMLPPAGALGSAIAVGCAALVLVMQATIPPAPPRLLSEGRPADTIQTESVVDAPDYRDFLSALSGELDDQESSGSGDDVPSGISELPFEEPQEEAPTEELPADEIRA